MYATHAYAPADTADAAYSITAAAVTVTAAAASAVTANCDIRNICKRVSRAFVDRGSAHATLNRVIPYSMKPASHYELLL